MSVQTQIDRLNKAKSDLKTSITNKGVTVSDDALISDYPALVDSIQTGSDLRLKDVQSVSYSANGSYNVLPDEGYDGMAKVIVDVNVPSKTFKTQEKTATANGEVVPDSGYDGLSKVTVNVPSKEFSGQTKTVSYSSNGSYKVKPDEGYDGLDEVDVTVNVAGGGGWKAPSSITFYGCTDDVLDVTGVDFSGVKTLVKPSSSEYGIFEDFKGSEIRGLSGVIGNAAQLFKGSNTVPDLSTISVSGDCNYMLASTKVKTLDLSALDVSEVTIMTAMLSFNTSATSINVSGWDTSKATMMNTMFYYCYGLTSLDVSSFNTSNVTYINSMFGECKLLTSLDLSNFDTSKVVNMAELFINCTALETVDISNFSIDSVNASYSWYNKDIFKNCTSLTTVKVINCTDAAKQYFLGKLQTDLPSYTWTLGDDGIITRS